MLLNIQYKRLGYVSVNSLENLGVNVDKNDPRLVNYEVYIKVKSTQKMNHNTSIKAKAFLDKVSFDIYSPIEPRTNRGLCYFISFIDSYSRYIEADIIKSKSKAFSSFRTYNVRTENSTSNSIADDKRPRLKLLRLDNALQFLTKEFKGLSQNSGIVYELSTALYPKSNAIIERPNRTIINKV